MSEIVQLETVNGTVLSSMGEEGKIVGSHSERNRRRKGTTKPLPNGAVVSKDNNTTGAVQLNFHTSASTSICTPNFASTSNMPSSYGKSKESFQTKNENFSSSASDSRYKYNNASNHTTFSNSKKRGGKFLPKPITESNRKPLVIQINGVIRNDTSSVQPHSPQIPTTATTSPSPAVMPSPKNQSKIISSNSSSTSSSAQVSSHRQYSKSQRETNKDMNAPLKNRNQQYKGNGQPKQKQKQQRHALVSTIDSDDLSAVISTSLVQGTYDCLICMDVIRRKDYLWSCQICWAVMHLSCVGKWAKSIASNASSTTTDIQSWRCPGCQNENRGIPTQFFCYCGKTQNPHSSPYLVPGSCGASCGRTGGEYGCSHPDSGVCHPGKIKNFFFFMFFFF